MITTLSIYEKEQCVLRHKNGTPLKILEEEYHVCRATIYRWSQKYNGDASSLKPNLSRKSIQHPKRMPLIEEQRLLEILHENPNITNKELAKLLGTNRTPAFLHKKREKLLGKRVIPYKNDYATFFDYDKIIQINQTDYEKGRIPKIFYIIEITNNLYLQKGNPRNPISVTPYFSMCIQFKSFQKASLFLKNLGNIKSEWIPKIRMVEKGALQLKNKA